MPHAFPPSALEICTPSNHASPVEGLGHVHLVVAYPVFCAPMAVECGHGSLSIWLSGNEVSQPRTPISPSVGRGEATGVWTHPALRSQRAEHRGSVPCSRAKPWDAGCPTLCNERLLEHWGKLDLFWMSNWGRELCESFWKENHAHCLPTPRPSLP